MRHRTYNPRVEPLPEPIAQAVELMAKAERPIFYVGGGVINSGGEASALVTELVRATGFPMTLTLMGLGAYPASDPQFIGMLGMHGTYEANLAMHGCDVMIAIGARFDDRVTGRLDKFSPGSRKIQVDIDPSSINKNVPVEVAIVGDAGHALRALREAWRAKGNAADPDAARALVAPDQDLAGQGQPALPPERHDHQAAVRDPAPLRADQGPRDLHHDRGRPASDVGGAALPVRAAAPLADLGRARHHGLRLARRDGRAGRASRTRS